MTTNVFDKGASLLASDSRWSFRLIEDRPIKITKALVYVDNTGFDKIEYQPDYSYIFAGPSDLINAWKLWINSPTRNLERPPGVTNDFAICIIETATGKIMDEHGQKITDDNYRFAGTGAKPAHECWMANKLAKMAVQSAMVHDPFSGGDVKFLELTTAKHNLNQTGTFESINKMALIKGMVMYMTPNQTPIPIDQASANDPRIKELADKIAKGDMCAEAPSGHDTIVWTETDVKRLQNTLEKMYGPLPK